MNKNNIKKAKDKAFTLIELTVVIIIIGILASIALPMYNSLVERSRTSEAVSTLKAILDAQKRSALEFEAYAGGWGGLDINVTVDGKYYNFSLDSPTFGDAVNDIVATAERYGSGYTITIDELGNFSCSDGSIILP